MRSGFDWLNGAYYDKKRCKCFSHPSALSKFRDDTDRFYDGSGMIDFTEENLSVKKSKKVPK